MAPTTHHARGPNARQLEWLATSRLPFSIAMRDYSAVRSAYLAWARPRYDLAWIGRGHGYVPLAGLVDAPTIVDLDDLEDRKIDAWLDVASHAKDLAEGSRPRQGASAHARSLGSRLLNTANRRRWRALEHRIADAVESVVVCSEDDRRHLGAGNAAVIPNGYPPPDRPAGSLATRHPPTMLLVGALTYAPNADAARFLVREVLPRVRERLPGTRVRLVGHHDERVRDLGGVEGVSLVGRVPDVVAELRLADVIVVPVRFGGGTRVKILEAFAHRIPVVSTTIGCEGLGAIPGRHLLVADEPDAVASACVTALVDLRVRRGLTDAAHLLYWRTYRSDIVARRVTELAAAVSDGRPFADARELRSGTQHHEPGEAESATSREPARVEPRGSV